MRANGSACRAHIMLYTCLVVCILCQIYMSYVFTFFFKKKWQCVPRSRYTGHDDTKIPPTENSKNKIKTKKLTLQDKMKEQKTKKMTLVKASESRRAKKNEQKIKINIFRKKEKKRKERTLVKASELASKCSTAPMPLPMMTPKWSLFTCDDVTCR